MDYLAASGTGERISERNLPANNRRPRLVGRYETMPFPRRRRLHQGPGHLQRRPRSEDPRDLQPDGGSDPDPHGVRNCYDGWPRDLGQMVRNVPSVDAKHRQLRPPGGPEPRSHDRSPLWL